MVAEVWPREEDHKDRSMSRHHKLKDFLDLLKQGLGLLSAIGGISGIASLVQGALKLVVRVCSSPTPPKLPIPT